MADVMKGLSVYKDRRIIVHAGYYDFCMQEECAHHGHEPSDSPRFQPEFSLTLKGFKRPIK
jgi:hypothetical protein